MCVCVCVCVCVREREREREREKRERVGGERKWGREKSEKLKRRRMLLKASVILPCSIFSVIISTKKSRSSNKSLYHDQWITGRRCVGVWIFNWIIWLDGSANYIKVKQYILVIPNCKTIRKKSRKMGRSLILPSWKDFKIQSFYVINRV